MAEPKDVFLQGGQFRRGGGRFREPLTLQPDLTLSASIPRQLMPMGAVCLMPQSAPDSDDLQGGLCWSALDLRFHDTTVHPWTGPGAAVAADGRLGHLHRWRVAHRVGQQPHHHVAGPADARQAALGRRARRRPAGALGQRGAPPPTLSFVPQSKEPGSPCTDGRRPVGQRYAPRPALEPKFLCTIETQLLALWMSRWHFDSQHSAWLAICLLPHVASPCHALQSLLFLEVWPDPR